MSASKGLLRRPALLAGVVAVPIAVVAGLLTWNITQPTSKAGGTDPDTPVAVTAPSPRPETAGPCANLAANLPYQLAALEQRTVTPASEQVVAWGEPAVVLRCGVTQPQPRSLDQVLGVNGVEWITAAGKQATVWTSVSLPTPVELTIPGAYAEEASTKILNPLAAPLHKHLAP